MLKYLNKVPWQLKLLFLMLVMAILPSFIISYNITGMIRDELKSNINQQLVSSSKEISSGINSEVNKSFETLSLFKNIIENQNLAADQKVALMVSGIKKIDNILSLSVTVKEKGKYIEAFSTKKDIINRNGKIISVNSNIYKIDFSKVIFDKDKTKFITSPEFSKELKIWTCWIVIKISIPGMVDAYLSELLNLTEIADDIDNHLISKRIGALFIADSAGNKFLTSKILADLPEAITEEAMNLLKIGNLSLIKNYPGNKEGSFVASFNRLENTKWITVSILREESAYAVVNNAFLYFALFVVVGIVISAIAAMLFSKHISKPIIMMANVSNRIADGKYEVDIDYKAKDSIGLLNGSLFKMGKQLKKNFEEIEEQKIQLEDYSHNLERKVEQRTNELSESNKELKKAYQKVLELNEEKNEFLGIAAHDLKNPLVAISGFAEIMKEDKEATIGDNEQFLDEIVKASGRMFSIVKNLLDVNAIEQGKLNTKMARVNVKDVLIEILGQFKESADKKEIRILDSYSHTENTILADTNITFQIIQNILSNAIKFSLPKKIIFITVISPENEDFLEIRIKDQGPGFSEEDKKKLFQKFARLSARPTAGEHSTGLGLSIVKKLVEMMNGSIRLESEIGKGAEFIITMPKYVEGRENE